MASHLISDAFHFSNVGNGVHLVLVTGHNELIDGNEMVVGSYVRLTKIIDIKTSSVCLLRKVFGIDKKVHFD